MRCALQLHERRYTRGRVRRDKGVTGTKRTTRCLDPPCFYARNHEEITIPMCYDIWCYPAAAVHEGTLKEISKCLLLSENALPYLYPCWMTCTFSAFHTKKGP